MADHRSKDGTFNGGKAFEMLSPPFSQKDDSSLGSGGSSSQSPEALSTW